MTEQQKAFHTKLTEVLVSKGATVTHREDGEIDLINDERISIDCFHERQHWSSVKSKTPSRLRVTIDRFGFTRQFIESKTKGLKYDEMADYVIHRVACKKNTRDYQAKQDKNRKIVENMFQRLVEKHPRNYSSPVSFDTSDQFLVLSIKGAFTEEQWEHILTGVKSLMEKLPQPSNPIV